MKVESEDMQIEETFRVKQKDTEEQTNVSFIKEETENIRIEEVFSLKQEDAEEQTNVSFIKEESENIRIQSETRFSLKQEDAEEQTNVSFNKEEREDIRTEEAFRVNHEDTEKQTVLPYQFEPESDPENADEQDDQLEHPLQARLQQDVSQWCRCENCNKMPSEAENVCCMEIPKVDGGHSTNVAFEHSNKELVGSSNTRVKDTNEVSPSILKCLCSLKNTFSGSPLWEPLLPKTEFFHLVIC
ncbi:gelsolin-related protein of 125 kDa-like [Chanodichthys erythropterus]|uniref:gelsolin-related protein of 125 kDa-like n=1 Tax=Chanodichthys erythropterus TaxID=933992 RepID=UPI00351DD4C1